jgi:hypothetical protein
MGLRDRILQEQNVVNAAPLRQKLPELDSPLEEAGLCRAFLLSLAVGVDLALSRIKDRVSDGGDDVPEADVRRRRSSWSCIVPWGIPGFSLTTHRERLLLLH